MSQPNENVLVVRRSLFDELGSFHGLTFEPEKYLSALLSRGNNFFLPRAQAENDPSYKQIIPYVSGGVGLGWIDSHASHFGAQGQDFTFNILTAVGVSYKIDDHWKATAGILYQHLSNGGQTDPNPSLNLLGPQIGATYSF